MQWFYSIELLIPSLFPKLEKILEPKFLIAINTFYYLCKINLEAFTSLWLCTNSCRIYHETTK